MTADLAAAGSGILALQIIKSHHGFPVDFHLPDALEMFSCLKRAGCPARLCLFHGENHELSRSGRPQNRIRRMEEILNWFDHYLK